MALIELFINIVRLVNKSARIKMTRVYNQLIRKY